MVSVVSMVAAELHRVELVELGHGAGKKTKSRKRGWGASRRLEGLAPVGSWKRINLLVSPDRGTICAIWNTCVVHVHTCVLKHLLSTKTSTAMNICRLSASDQLLDQGQQGVASSLLTFYVKRACRLQHSFASTGILQAPVTPAKRSALSHCSRRVHSAVSFRYGGTLPLQNDRDPDSNFCSSNKSLRLTPEPWNNRDR